MFRLPDLEIGVGGWDKFKVIIIRLVFCTALDTQSHTKAQ